MGESVFFDRMRAVFIGFSVLFLVTGFIFFSQGAMGGGINDLWGLVFICILVLVPILMIASAIGLKGKRSWAFGTGLAALGISGIGFFVLAFQQLLKDPYTGGGWNIFVGVFLLLGAVMGIISIIYYMRRVDYGLVKA